MKTVRSAEKSRCKKIVLFIVTAKLDEPLYAYISRLYPLNRAGMDVVVTQFLLLWAREPRGRLFNSLNDYVS
jgi:hypothetical protein